MTTQADLIRSDLSRLPLRALAALLARGAKRHRPQFDLPGDTPDRAEHMNAVDKAIRIVWEYAKGGDFPEAAAQELATGGLSAACVGPGNAFGIPAHKAAMAIGAVFAALYMTHETAIDRALQSIQSDGLEAQMVRQDYEKLRGLGLGTFPDPGQPIDPASLGPMWPEDHI